MVKTIVLLALLLFNQCINAAVVATVDRTEIAVNESLNLRYESSGEEKRTPDFSPINNDFDIIGQNKETSLSIINGQASQKTIYNLSLTAKRTGKLLIPEINFANGTSASIAVNVKQSIDRKSDKSIIFDVSVDKSSAYVQEQIIIKVKLARAVQAQQESISDLNFSHQDIIVEPLSNDYQRYDAMLNGRRHIVYERNYAVYPQKAGELILSPLSYNAVIPDKQQSRGSFFDDPFFNRSSGRRIRESSSQIILNVKEKPAEFIGKTWLPAKQVIVKAELSGDTDNIKVGDSITRIITIQAQQQLASILPEIKTINLENARSYPDQDDTQQQANSSGISSQRIERTAIVPTQSGELVFPEQSIEWWDTETQQKQIAIIPAQKLRVAATPLTPTTEQQTQSNTNSTSPAASSSKHWFYLSLFAFLGWFMTIAAWLYTQFKNKPQAIKNKTTKSALIKACQQQDAKQAKLALIAWAQQTWPDKNIQHLGAIVNIANDVELNKAINELQDYLYGQGNKKWQGKTLRDSIKNFKANTGTSEKDRHILFNIQ